MSSSTRSTKKFAFISGYLWLLAVPMLLGIGGMFALSVYNHRASTERKLSNLNRMAAVSEARMLDHLQQLMSIEVTSDKLHAVTHSEKTKSEYRKIWAEKVGRDVLISQIFYADSSGEFISNTEAGDLAWRTSGLKLSSRDWYQGAVRSSSFYWTDSYKDIRSGDFILTLAHRLESSDGIHQRVIGLDVNIASWSQMLRDMLYGTNGVNHMVIDRRTSQILVSSQDTLNGQSLKAPWYSRLTSQSGSFYSNESDEYVAYGNLPGRAHWLAITVQPRRDSVGILGASIAGGLLVIACVLFVTFSAFFRLRLLVLLDNLINRVRQVRSSSMTGNAQILPAFPEMALLQEELNLVSDHLQESYDQANRDALTGLYNRRFLDARLRELHREGRMFVLALVDLDNFKLLNDVYGHASGDAALHRTASLGSELLGSEVVLCRYGGEELVALFEQATLAEAESLIEQWRCRVSEMKWREKGMRVTFSCGIGVSNGRSPEVLMALVDDAMYRAKRTGKNRLYRIEGS